MQKLNFEVKKFNIEPVENAPSFYNMTLYAISDGVNRNGSNFTVQSMQKALLTVVNKPILCFYNSITQNMEEHNCDVVLNDDETDIEYKYDGNNAEHPCGIILSGSIQEYQGKQWLVLNGQIWSKYSQHIITAIQNNIKDNNTQKISVEISVSNSHQQFEVEILDEWEFDGVVLLGFLKNTTEFCQEGIEGANAVPNDYAKSQQFTEFKHQMSFAYDQVKVGDNGKMKKKYSVNDDELGKSSSITIKNDKANAIMSGTWSKPSASFLDSLLKASNHTALVNEAYLVADGDASSNLAIGDVHYPHHTLKGNTLVVNAKGCQAALSRGMAQGNLTSSEKAHLKRHYKELALNTTDNFKKFELSKIEYSYLFKEEEDNMKIFIEKAKENGYSFLGIKSSNLIFIKDKSFEAEEDLNSDEMCKMSVYEVGCDTADDEKDFTEADFKEKDLRMADDPDGDGDDDSTDNSNTDDDSEKECNALKVEKQALEVKCSELEVHCQSYDTEKAEYETVKTAFEAEKAEYEAKKVTEETEKKEKDFKVLETVTDEIMNEKDFGLDEDSIKELCQMRSEYKFATVDDFIKEAAYRKEVKRMSTKKKNNSLNYSFNNPTNHVVDSDKKETLDSKIDNVIKKYK